MKIEWLAVVGVALFTSAAFAQPAGRSDAGKAKTDAPHFSGIRPCGQSASMDGPCQLALPPEQIPILTGSGSAPVLNFAAHGEDLDVLYRSGAPRFLFGEAPYLCCDLQTFLTPLSAGVWGARIRTPDLDRAAIQLTIGNLATPAPAQPFVGAHADHVLLPQKWSEHAVPLTDKIRVHSKALGQDRDLYVYRGDRCKGGVSGCDVAYFADGGEFNDYLLAPPPSGAALLRNTVIVGLADPPNDDQFGSERAAELLSGGHDPAFGAFERFLTEEVIPLVEGPGASPRTRLVGGWSNGGGWARDMALRHPDLFSGALAFSIGGIGKWTPPDRPTTPKPVFWLGSGTLEDKFFEDEKRQATALSQLTFDVRQKYVVGGHSPSTWNALFWWALADAAALRRPNT